VSLSQAIEVGRQRGQEGFERVEKKETQVIVTAVAMANNPSQATQTKCLVTQLVIGLLYASCKVDILIDCGAHQNFLSQKFALEEGLIADPTTIGAHTINKHRVIIYRRHTVEMQATDKDGVTRSSKQEFLATDMDDYQVILGLPWMEAFRIVSGETGKP
jgi:hypothetical protein